MLKRPFAFAVFAMSTEASMSNSTSSTTPLSMVTSNFSTSTSTPRMSTWPDADTDRSSTPGPKVTWAPKLMLVRRKPSTSIDPACDTDRDPVVVAPFWSSDPATSMVLPKIENPPENDTSFTPCDSSRNTETLVSSNCNPPKPKDPMSTVPLKVVGSSVSAADTSTVVPSTAPSNASWKPAGMAGTLGASWHPVGATMNSK